MPFTRLGSMRAAWEASFTGESVSFEAEAGDGAVISDNGIEVTKNNASVTLTFEGLPDSETYVYVTGLSYAGYSPDSLESDEAVLSAYARNRARHRQKYWKEAAQITVKLAAYDTDGDSSSGELNYYTPKYTWYGNREDFLVNMGYDNNSRTSITLTFTRTGSYTFDSLEVSCQPMDRYAEQAAALAEEVMEDVDFHETETDRNAADRVTGTISLSRASCLLLTIPYSTGWTAYVDGVKQELLQANTMYFALYLEAGEHEISLVYHTPGLAAGAAVSGAAITVFFLAAVWRKKRLTGKGRFCSFKDRLY